MRMRPLTIPDILRWADAHRETTGQWPTSTAGDIPGTHGLSWAIVDNALSRGSRGLPGGSSLRQLLAEQRGVRHPHRLPPLTEQQILAWADAHHQRTGAWPVVKAGRIPDTGGENWNAIDAALRAGRRGLPGNSSLAQLLSEHRGVRNPRQVPPLTEEQILAWADQHHARTGTWPIAASGPIVDAPGETWLAVDSALKQGYRGLPGKSSLALLLADKRQVRNPWTRPGLTIEQILAWADAYHARSGQWPSRDSGPIAQAPGETWCAVSIALKDGLRGLPGKDSLARLLARERGIRNRVNRPRLSRQQILAWADAHFQRTGVWPTEYSGPVVEAPEENWSAIDQALRWGRRGLRGGSSLYRLLAQRRGRRNRQDLPPLTRRQILAWADAHFQRTGQWPTCQSGPVQDAPGERWDLIDVALRNGLRGRPGGSSLRCLLVKMRGIRDRLNLPPLSEDQIVRWAELHRQRTGQWPRKDSGPIADAPGETWSGVNAALRLGGRGLCAGSSLAQLLASRQSQEE